MTFEEIITLPIKDVSERSFHDGSVCIWFTIDNHVFYIDVIQSKHKFKVSSISHDRIEKECPLCLQKGRRSCFVLNQHRKDFFQTLIQSKPLRLPWLYREYKIF